MSCMGAGEAPAVSAECPFGFSQEVAANRAVFCLPPAEVMEVVDVAGL